VGRKKLLDRPIDVHVTLPSSVVAQLEILLADPLTGKPKHGSRAKLITRLVKQWIAEQQREESSSQRLHT
jgi:hypothetical protein